MKTCLKAFLLVALSVFLVTGLMAEDSDKPPYTVGASYILVFGPITPLPAGTELPAGPVTIAAESGDWIQIQYSTSKKARSKDNPGEIVSVETIHKAWVNLDYIAAFLEPTKAE